MYQIIIKQINNIHLMQGFKIHVSGYSYIRGTVTVATVATVTVPRSTYSCSRGLRTVDPVVCASKKSV